jgi:pyruvate/2-oxoglutarate dehydrogenase complex dihydrolipoamide acyltransferase (E2) component
MWRAQHLGGRTDRTAPCAYAGELVICWTVNLTSAFNHRVVDGVAGAGLLRKLVELVKNPGRLLLDLK